MTIQVDGGVSLGVEFLNFDTVSACILGAGQFSTTQINGIVAQLLDLGILIKKGSGKGVYEVVQQSKPAKENAAAQVTDATKILVELPGIVKRAGELKGALPDMRKDLNEKKESLRRCRARIPVLEGEISELESRVNEANSFLESEGTIAALQLASMMKGFAG
jgi:polyhydroxyalkanoate synthesis regulator phasin